MSVTAARGFVAAGLPAGIKASGAPDLALVATEDAAPVPAAAVFTRNKAAAAPVQVSQRHLTTTGGRAAAVVLNSGNANAATGVGGVETAERMCAGVAAAIGCAPHEVLVCSTGLIGIPLDASRVESAVPSLASKRSPDGGTDAADAILTTDTRRKEVVVHATNGVVIGGMAKGAAMLAPNMATMLAVLTTDAVVGPADLRAALARAVDESFNRLSVDGCTSTNDTVIVLASGRAGPAAGADFQDRLTEACLGLARQMAADAEGATKTVTVSVRGAVTDAEALAAARAVADSQLTKCSWYGEDPYWGRVASDIGSSGVAFEMGRLAIAYGGVVVAREGVAVDHDEAAVKKHMGSRDIEVAADLGLGTGEGWILTNDLTHAYVDENMGTS